MIIYTDHTCECALSTQRHHLQFIRIFIPIVRFLMIISIELFEIVSLCNSCIIKTNILSTSFPNTEFNVSIQSAELIHILFMKT